MVNQWRTQAICELLYYSCKPYEYTTQPPWNVGMFPARQNKRVVNTWSTCNPTCGSKFCGPRESIYQILEMRKISFRSKAFSWLTWDSFMVDVRFEIWDFEHPPDQQLESFRRRHINEPRRAFCCVFWCFWKIIRIKKCVLFTSWAEAISNSSIKYSTVLVAVGSRKRHTSQTKLELVNPLQSIWKKACFYRNLFGTINITLTDQFDVFLFLNPKNVSRDGTLQTTLRQLEKRTSSRATDAV